MQEKRLRIRATGQVGVFVLTPAIRAMIAGGTAVEIDAEGRELVEAAALAPAPEAAIAPAQKPKLKARRA